MGLLLVLFTLFLSITPLFASIFDERNINDSKSFDSNLQTNPTTRILAQNPFYQCDIFPRMCRARDSAGPDCCKKKCVNVDTDRLNCGFCGNKCASGKSCCKGRCVNVLTNRSNCGFCGQRCGYNESCCKGKCRNTHFDKRNCGACQNECKIGEFCAYGMCNYA